MIDLSKEILKLNYALGSYKCSYKAEYKEDTIEGLTTLLVVDKDGSIILSHKFAGEAKKEDLDYFKSDAIKLCSHA